MPREQKIQEIIVKTYVFAHAPGTTNWAPRERKIRRAWLGSANIDYYGRWLGWLGSAQAQLKLGSARPGPAQLGSARIDPARLGSARLGAARSGTARKFTICSSAPREFW